MKSIKNKKLSKEFSSPTTRAKEIESDIRSLLRLLPQDKNVKWEDTMHRMCEKLNQIENNLPTGDYPKILMLWKLKQQFIHMITSEVAPGEVARFSAMFFKIPMNIDVIIYAYYHSIINETNHLIRLKEFDDAEKNERCFVELQGKLKEFEAEYDADIAKVKVNPNQKGALQGILKICKNDYIQDERYIRNQIINFDVLTEEIKTPKPELKDKDTLAIEAEIERNSQEPSLFKKMLNFLTGKKNNDNKK